jgi:GNAT superfamily N-acetyltransferase
MIRLLEASDAEAFHQLRLEGLRESAPAFGSSYEEECDRPIAAVAERLSRDPAESFVLGAIESSGALVGVVGFYRGNRRKDRHKGHVWGMVVAPQVRGRGVGRALLESLIGRARDIEGLASLHLSVTLGQDAARRLYLSCGFDPYGLELDALRVEGVSYDQEHMVLVIHDPG